MRTIKFRGKRCDNGEWAYGYLYKLQLPIEEACLILTQDNNHLDVSLAPKYDLAFKLGVDLFIVDPETVGQFTGLYDKNGKGIYEGDIVEFYHLKTYCINPDCDVHLLGYGTRLIKAVEVVEFKDGMFGVEDDYFGIIRSLDCGLMNEEDYKEEISDPYFDANGYDVENIEALIGLRIIGNIHDNPELLGGGEV